MIIELDIGECTIKHVKAMTNFIYDLGFEISYHGYDHMVIKINNFNKFSELVYGLDNICIVYGKVITSLLV